MALSKAELEKTETALKAAFDAFDSHNASKLEDQVPKISNVYGK